ncbi:MAG: hypothetical protein DCF22_06635 [Leptolyngbya sp.]|nr:MAG: hypothetical protein DCF22_06635 [Leptolyngbya sp.]
MGAIAALSSNFAAIAISTPSSPINADDIRTGQSVRSPMNGKLAQQLAQRNRNCRRIVADRSIPFNDVAEPGNRLGNLTRGDKVELSNGTNTTLGVDGRSYIGVRIPYIESSYNRVSQQSGYIPARYQGYDGVMRSTLGACQIRALW